MKPWREVAVPNADVLQGTFKQAEFAADITAVRTGKASRIYQEAEAFFERTFITEGMRLLLTQVAQRLSGHGGEPVVQLQTAFGGGKTHTMLAVYHLATREGSLQKLAGIPQLLDQAGLMDVPKAKVAVLDGTAHAPGQPWKHGRQAVHTLWGELAWQLGGHDAFEALKGADQSGTSPGKDALRELLEAHAPCVVLIDELVAYVRQFPDGQAISGGTYDSNLSFVQALTEAIKLVPNALLLASLPESDTEAGSSRGVNAKHALEKVFGRVQALWKPVDREESFEIVRRRLFEPIRDLSARDEVCGAFYETYAKEGPRLPALTHEARYLDRLTKAYPIHPEVFDRLYEDWATLDGFQRTRGVLKLMANVIHELWRKGDKDLLILPSSLPLYRGKTRDELVAHLPPGWEQVLDRDIDDEHSEATDLDTREGRFGAVQAARRVARATFFASAPSSGGGKTQGQRGVNRPHLLLACLQPGQSSSLFGDALNRLADRLHYLNASGDKTQDSTCFWFDTRANLRREMEDRKQRFEEGAVRGRLGEVLGKLAAGKGLFDATHVFTPHADVPDDSQLRLVLVDPDRPYSKQEPRPASEAVLEYVRQNGSRPRFKGNRLVFVAADGASLGRLRDAARTALAWGSIVEDIAQDRLVIDQLQAAQAKKERETADAVVVRAARECYRWVLCPVMQAATDREPLIEPFPMNTGNGTFGDEVARVCEENELVIKAWALIHLRSRLKELYWKDGKVAVRALAVWEDFQKYLYLPRLKDRSVFAKVIEVGAGSADFFGTAGGQEGEKFLGFKLGDGHVQLDDQLLLIEPDAARAYRDAQATVSEGPTLSPAEGPRIPPAPGDLPPRLTAGVAPCPEYPVPVPVAPKPANFFGSFEVSAATAKVKLVDLASEIISALAGDPNAQVKVTLEIQAEFPKGVDENLKRAVNDNARQLGFKPGNWE